jgi:hypothetical protein
MDGIDDANNNTKKKVQSPDQRPDDLLLLNCLHPD